MKVRINGTEHEVPDGTTVTHLAALVGAPSTGVAVAVDDEVRPRSRWDEPVTAGARVEVLRAVQGG